MLEPRGSHGNVSKMATRPLYKSQYYLFLKSPLKETLRWQLGLCVFHSQAVWVLKRNARSSRDIWEELAIGGASAANITLAPGVIHSFLVRCHVIPRGVCISLGHASRVDWPYKGQGQRGEVKNAAGTAS